MSKSFRELVEAINAKSREEFARTRSRKEKDFAASHGNPVKTGGPNDKEYPAKNTDNVLNARSAKETDKHDNTVPGERAVVKQGTSTKTFNQISKEMKQTPARPGDKREGDKQIVRLSPSAVKGVVEDAEMNDDLKNIIDDANAKLMGEEAEVEEEIYLDEGNVLDQLRSIAKSFKGGEIKFNDGDVASVEPTSAHKVLKVFEKLSPQNQKKFSSTVSKSAEGFLKMLDFSKRSK